MVSLFTVCDLAARNYPQVNRDLLLTGAFLHDIGKVHELAYQRSIAYTTKGQLLGHMIIELEMLHQKIARLPGFPDELKILIEHMIISHHGQYEFGSPKLPMFPEALMLHYLDDLDSKMESMRAQFEREAELDSAWTSYNPSLARPLLNTKKFLEKGLAASRVVEPPKPVPAAAVAGSSEEAAGVAAGDQQSDTFCDRALEWQGTGVAAGGFGAQVRLAQGHAGRAQAALKSHRSLAVKVRGPDRPPDRLSLMLDFSRFDWLSFDCYGTLIDWETGLLGYLRPLLQGKGCDISDARILALYSEFEPRQQAGTIADIAKCWPAWFATSRASCASR